MKKKELNHRKIEELYDAGRTDKEIASALGVKGEAIRAWRKARRLPSNDVKQRKELSQLEKDAIAAHEMGMTYGQYKAMKYVAPTLEKGKRIRRP